MDRTGTGPPDAADAEESQNRRLAWFVACGVVLGWGINFVLAKHALNQFSVGSFNFIRFGGMAALGWVVVGITGGRTPVAPEHRRLLVLVSVVGFCGYVFGFSVGLSYTSAFSASLLLALVPLWVAIFDAALTRELPPAKSLFALALAAAGTALFVGSRTSVSLGWGDAISLLVAALYAGYLMLNRRRPLPAVHPHDVCHLDSGRADSSHDCIRSLATRLGGGGHGWLVGHGLGDSGTGVCGLVVVELGSPSSFTDAGCTVAVHRARYERPGRMAFPR